MSFTSFQLNTHIITAIQACGYTTPTPVQQKSIPIALAGNDIIVSAPTGTGKTASFILPALNLLTQTKSTGKPRILVLTPTRELARQVAHAADTYSKFLRINVVSLVGGMPYPPQIRSLSRPTDVIIATPGRLMDHLERKRIDLSEIKMLILDEADRMLDMGFIDDVKAIAKLTPKNRQTLLFSATVSDKLSIIAKQLLNNPTRIDLDNKQHSPPEIKQELYLADNVQHKNQLFEHLLVNGNIYKAIIFSGTKVMADKLALQLCDKGFLASVLHGDLKQNIRNRTVTDLRHGKIQFLVATDVASRGIDIADITHVINYDLPKFSEDYVHRIGRTGRAGKSGIAISLALPNDATSVKRIERYIGQRLALATIAGLEPKKQFGQKQNDFRQHQKPSGKGKKYISSYPKKKTNSSESKPVRMAKENHSPKIVFKKLKSSTRQNFAHK